MKRLALAVLLLAPFAARAQNSATFTITVVAPPLCTVTLAANPVSTSGTKLYSGQSGVINFNISACPSASASATATWDAVSTPTTFIASPATLSMAISAAQASVGTHTLVLTIPAPLLSLTSPVTLPNAPVGRTYSASLASLSGVTGGVPPYTWSLDPTTPLPAGLSLSSGGVVSGTPSVAASANFGFTVKDSSIPLLHSAALTWSASTSAVVGYNVYRRVQTTDPTSSSTSL